MYEWNDVRCFLAVARRGSTLAASRELRVNQTTVARRIAALEKALKLRLFDRTAAGYRLTEDGEALMPAAERLEHEAATLAGLAGQRRRLSGGVIRVTTSDILAGAVLTPSLAAFAALHPDVAIHTLVDDRRLDLLAGQADIALRVGPAPQEPELVARRLLEASWGLYCNFDYARRRGVPRGVEALEGHSLIGFDGALDGMPAARWLRDYGAGANVVGRSNSLANHVQAIRAGLGIGALPRIEGDRHADLLLCLARMEGAGQSLWLLLRPEARHWPRVRAFADFLVERVLALRAEFEGRSPGAAAGPASV